MQTALYESATPMMRQWHLCKQKATGSLLLFRMGDFYEAFYEDAEILAKTLNLTLTQRQNIPMAGIPFHALQNYLDRLIAEGLKVAIAEQTEDPKKAKGLVKRELTRIVTPGTLVDSNLLKAQSHNFCASVCQVGAVFGLALVDISTGSFLVSEYPSLDALFEELHRYGPKELLLSSGFKEKYEKKVQELKASLLCTLTLLDKWRFEAQSAHENLMQQFQVQSLDGFGLRGKTAAINGAGALLAYLTETLCLDVHFLKKIQVIQDHQFLILDPITLKHLEIVQPQHEKGPTLYSHLNQTQTAMGARLLRDWVQKPSSELKVIHLRQEAIQKWLNHPESLKNLRKALSCIQDLERLLMRLHSSYGSAKDLVALKHSLSQIPEIKELLQEGKTPITEDLQHRLHCFEDLVQNLEQALVDEPPLKLGEGKTFKLGYHKELDEWLSFNGSAKQWIANYQSKIKEETQIKTLKIGYNRVFGYYIEVSKGQAHLVPSSFHRRQTLANNERFISEELKSYETRIFQAEEKILLLEQKLLEDLKSQVLKFTQEILDVSKAIAELDALLSLAFVAYQNHYVQPLVDESSVLQINQGAHPLLDQQGHFIPNDTFLDEDQNRLALLTGPNMAGKSTYIRQVALLVLMAQIGSFLPVQSAHIGLVDRIFTRIGASDDLSRGQSTFMVEMVETANILNHASEKSLVILDEIGRGTSTYDGIAIAQATALYLLRLKAKTLFATHYSELTQLETKHPGVINYTVGVHESSKGIQFLYKIQKGSTDKSYGIHVAELAGLPSSLLQEAKSILENLEQHKVTPLKKAPKSTQLTFFANEAKVSWVEEEIKKLRLDDMTPLEALSKLADYQRQIS